MVKVVFSTSGRGGWSGRRIRQRWLEKCKHQVHQPLGEHGATMPTYAKLKASHYTTAPTVSKPVTTQQRLPFQSQSLHNSAYRFKASHYTTAPTVSKPVTTQQHSLFQERPGCSSRGTSHGARSSRPLRFPEPTPLAERLRATGHSRAQRCAPGGLLQQSTRSGSTARSKCW
jgi:hypothetical protein